LGGVEVGWGCSRVYRESKGVKVFCFFSSFMGVDNSIRLKELQVVSGALKGQGVKFFFSFSKGFFWVRRGGWGNSTPF